MTDTSHSRYVLSFTKGALLSREAAILAPVYCELRDWAAVRRVAVSDNLLQARTQSSSRTMINTAVQRMAVLNDDELEALVEMPSSERNYLMWAAACRQYTFIAEFAEEVLREHYLTLASTVTYEDYASFVLNKSAWHDELMEIKPKTATLLRWSLFKMMREAALLTDDNRIEPALLSERLIDFFSARVPSDLRFFPVRPL